MSRSSPDAPPDAPSSGARAWLGLGTNIGERALNLRRAIAALHAAVTVHAVSDVYESAAVGYTDQPHFWNLAVAVSTPMPPAELLAAVKGLERELGRTATFAMGPRVIDIDVLLYDDVHIDTTTLTVPHPRLLERAFVLRPLLDLDPELQHPVTGERLADRIRRDGGDALLTRVAAAHEMMESPD